MAVRRLSPGAGDDAWIVLKSIRYSAEAALSLARICLARDADVALRQSAGINLKKYVREHWSAAFETFEGNPPSFEVSMLVLKMS